MIRIALFCSVLVFGAVGCVTLKPIGPLAKEMSSPPGSSAPEPMAKATAPKDMPSGPVIQPAPPPPAPRTDVTPGEVTETNTADIIRRLQAELEADRKAGEAMPRPSEVSVVK